MPHRPPLRQFDLFAKGAEDALEVPWPTLPPETRSKVTDLMAQLILDHRRNVSAQHLDGENGDA